MGPSQRPRAAVEVMTIELFGLGRRADTVGELRRRAPTSTSSSASDAAACPQPRLRGLPEAADAQQEMAARWRQASSDGWRVTGWIGTACPVVGQWSGRPGLLWQQWPRRMSLRTAFTWNACLMCVRVDAGGSGVSGELRAMGTDFAGLSAADCMHAGPIDGVPRVCTVLCSVFHSAVSRCQVCRFSVPRDF